MGNHFSLVTDIPLNSSHSTILPSFITKYSTFIISLVRAIPAKLDILSINDAQIIKLLLSF
jgi:hypothetical protein